MFACTKAVCHVEFPGPKGGPPRAGAIVVAQPEVRGAYDFGAWWSSDAAAALLAALDDAAAPPAPAARSVRVHDLLRTSTAVFKRCVEWTDGAEQMSDDQMRDWQESTWRATTDWGYAYAQAVLLTHTFSWPEAGAETEVCLRTLVATLAEEMPQLQRALFGAALADSGDSRVTCVVELRGEALSAGALAALPPSLRAALKQRRKAQVLSALATCVRRRWVGGTALLCSLAAPLLPADAVRAGLDPLALRLGVGFAGDAADTQTPTVTSCVARILAAEALEAAGKFAAAAQLYRACLEDEARVPGVLRAPPCVWQYLGLALKRAGDIDGAIAAYQAGLDICGSCRLELNLPAWRETLRLRLLQCLLNITPPELDGPTAFRMFENVVPQPRWDKPRRFVHHPTDGTWLEEIGSGRRWALVLTGARPDLPSDYLECMMRIPDRVGPFVDGNTPPATGKYPLVRQGDGNGHINAGAQTTDGAQLARGPGAVPLPRLRGTCAACGAVRAGLKMCAACGLTEYCDRECQLAAWPAHKRACRAAAAAAKQKA